ncbi:MAG: hypothetical protein M3N41_00355 [Acidobacteriota bacterium]|nr:hypothetical protein [Acidobacteriota bacterium]
MIGLFPGTTRLMILATLAAGGCRAEWVTGVLYGENGGQGANPVRGIELAVGNDIYRLEYAPRFFQPHYRNKVCWQIGAIWRVNVSNLQDLGGLIDATCRGQTDARAHEPVRLVQKYLDDLAKDPATSFLVRTASSRWKNSPEFAQYQSQAKDLVLSTNLGSGPAGCLEVVKVVRSGLTEVQAIGCSIELRDKITDLHFSVVQKPGTKRWEIDEIRIE